MIALILNLSLAITPDDLATRAPTAARTLDRCAEEGCPPEVGAQAAWLLAVHRYLDGGEADGELAATVRSLDPQLFADLPDTLQAAVGVPMGWARTRAREPAAPAAPADDAAQPPKKSGKIRTSMLWIWVSDPEGRPISNAMVRSPMEGMAYAVAADGGWANSVFYLPNGAEFIFERGAEVPMEIWAPGYELLEERFLLKNRRETRVTVVLEPWTPTVEAGAPEVARQAVEGYARWVELEAKAIDASSGVTRQDIEALRAELATAARAWMDAGGGEVARTICLQAGSREQCGR